jgi:hypothetical protein
MRYFLQKITAGFSDSEFLQVGCGFSGIRRLLCHILCCFGMFDWNCSLLLLAMHNCNSLCCCRTGIKKELVTTTPISIFLQLLSVVVSSVTK